MLLHFAIKKGRQGDGPFNSLVGSCWTQPYFFDCLEQKGWESSNRLNLTPELTTGDALQVSRGSCVTSQVLHLCVAPAMDDSSSLPQMLPARSPLLSPGALPSRPVTQPYKRGALPSRHQSARTALTPGSSLRSREAHSTLSSPGPGHTGQSTG